ncbi:uncharacterized protein STEHIDRAFT_134870 [Stereum hirsutum FP-91666 SS1]|uniref:uncharacterized protein n=1 Tax=Stereum hirsutum (strain FP-91666) TaxID=721885 RepID=UPI0004449514|nr:uncharacterized protein STEHIDRAFT_134870 [Stereum hirsutum FP-91666 SS1]EIM81253.1 hypothetical protein STEHIDRAFT_134870 [Stereum hirsutum FP-91666 SS1]
MISLLVKEKLYINEVVLGTGLGVLMGPHCANVFDPRSWSDDSDAITLEVMRVVLAVGLFAIGVELPQSYMYQHAKSLLIVVVPTMALGWVVTAAFMFLLFPRLDYISCLAISACLTPTDPIISAAIIGGKFAIKHVPVNLRRLLAAESAANDGLAYPFLSISIYLTTEASRAVAVGKWFLIGWLYQVILGVVLGSVLGVMFSHLMKFSHKRGFIDQESYVAQYLSLAIFTIGVTKTIGSDDLLAAFAAGSAVSWDGHFNTQVEDELFSSIIDLVLNCAAFIYIGAWLPFEQFNATDLGLQPWRLLVLFLVILTLRRIPALLLLYRWVPEIRNWREALFSGHFGPMGVGAIFISTLALTELETPQSPPQNQQQLLAAVLQPMVAFVVLGSIIIHGFSVPFLSFGRKVHSRTISLSQTFTSRGSDGAVPDWLLWARRPGTASPNTTTFDDVEGGRVIPISETQQISGDMRAGVSLIQEADIVGMNPARAGKESDGGHAKSESEECPRTVSPDGVERERREAINEGTFVGPEFGEASMLASPKQARIVKRPPPLTDVDNEGHAVESNASKPTLPTSARTVRFPSAQ